MEKVFYKGSDNKIYRFRVERDTEPMNPRKEWDNITHMMCWYKGYDLGDENPFDSPDELLNEMIRQEYTDMQIVNYIRRKAKKAKDDETYLDIVYNRNDGTYELYKHRSEKDAKRYAKIWRLSEDSKEYRTSLITENPKLDWLADDILDEMSMKEKISLIEKKGYYFLPLAVYEHSGITMYVGSRWDHFDAQWDCSDIGWIYISKKDILCEKISVCGDKGKRITATSKNWKKVADMILRGDVKTYDQYLQGDVYASYIEELDQDETNDDSIEDIEEDDSIWSEVECCGGYFSEKWGNELVKEIYSEAVGDIPCYDSLKDVLAA